MSSEAGHVALVEKLRLLVKSTCHTPLLVAGQFVATYESDRTEVTRKTIATEDELLRALEFQVRTLQTANVYLRSEAAPAKPTITEARQGLGAIMRVAWEGLEEADFASATTAARTLRQLLAKLKPEGEPQQ